MISKLEPDQYGIFGTHTDTVFRLEKFTDNRYGGQYKDFLKLECDFALILGFFIKQVTNEICLTLLNISTN